MGMYMKVLTSSTLTGPIWIHYHIHHYHNRFTSSVFFLFFVGIWSFGLRSGKGILTLANGDVYDGHWKEDKKHGAGILDCSDGR